MTPLATQAAEYASAMASAYAMDWHTWPIDIAAVQRICRRCRIEQGRAYRAKRGATPRKGRAA